MRRWQVLSTTPRATSLARIRRSDSAPNNRRSTGVLLSEHTAGGPPRILVYFDQSTQAGRRTKGAGHGEEILDAFAALGNSIAIAIPRIAVGILLIILGLVVAKLVEVVLRTMLIRVRFDSLMERAGVPKALRRIGLRQQLSLLLPNLAYFLVIFCGQDRK